jgi:hypothetical protein
VRNGIRDLDVRDSSAAAFARDARGAIVGHYERNCDAIIAESEALARTGNVEEALARLFAVPVDAGGCHGRTSDEVVRLYDANESRICEAQLQRARAELAVDRFAEAVAALGAVRRAGPCGDQVDELIGELEREVREQDEAWFEAELERYQAFTDTIGDGIRANQGEAAANQERSRRMAESLAEQTFNKPEALAVSADFWTVSRS